MFHHVVCYIIFIVELFTITNINEDSLLLYYDIFIIIFLVYNIDRYSRGLMMITMMLLLLIRRRIVIVVIVVIIFFFHFREKRITHPTSYRRWSDGVMSWSVMNLFQITTKPNRFFLF